MGKYSIRQSVNHSIVPLRDSFHFNYGRATVTLDPYGTYTLSVNGSEYSEFVNSARRAYQYKPTVLALSEKMKAAYDQQTFDYTHLNYDLPPSRTRVSVENALDKLVLKKYKNKPFSLPKPSEVEIRSELEYEASQLFFKTFGKDDNHIGEYVDAHIQDALNQRIQTWTSLSDFHDAIQSQNAEKQNLIYFKEYTDKKEELEQILNGPASYVEAEARKKLSEIRLPFDIELDYSYSERNKLFDIEVEVPASIPIPFEKASLLASGKVSVKNKTAKEQELDLKLCLYSLPFYLASKFFDISTNIETISITVWTENKTHGCIWVEFPRDEFNDLIKRNRSFDPVYYISIGHFFSPLSSPKGSMASIESSRNVFLKRIAEIKAIKNNRVIQSQALASSTRKTFTSYTSGDGDMNPDPIILSLSEAHFLAKEVNDPSIEDNITNAVWAGERTVTVNRKYLDVWERIKKENWKK